MSSAERVIRMTTRQERRDREPEKKRPPSGVFEKAFNGGEGMFSQAIDLLKSDRTPDRLNGMGILLNLAIEGDDLNAKKELLSMCRRAIASEDFEERNAVRKVLGQLALKGDCRESQKILEVDYLQIIADMDLEALVFLGMHGKKGINREADAVLERKFDTITGKENLDILAYIAAMSTCSIEVRRKAAEISAKHEKRAGNLAFIRDTCDDELIRHLMDETLKEQGIFDTGTVDEDESDPDPRAIEPDIQPEPEMEDEDRLLEGEEAEREEPDMDRDREVDEEEDEELKELDFDS